MFGVLIRFARKIVQTISSQLMQQLNVVQEQAYAPMQQMVQQVTSGIWVGRGADAFVEEVSSLMMPNVNQIGDTITTMNKNLLFAVDVIDQADQAVSSAVNSLADTFGSIF